MCICVCVCKRESERERVSESERERERDVSVPDFKCRFKGSCHNTFSLNRKLRGGRIDGLNLVTNSSESQSLS